MRKAFFILLALAGLATLTLVGIGALFLMFKATSSGVPSRVVLEVNLESAFIENVPDDATATVLFDEAPRVRDLVDALHAAAGDDRVVGLLGYVGSGSSGFAVSQEIRDAVKTFGESGKFTMAFSETFGEAGPGNIGYYLATAFDEIWMQPSGDVNLTGFIAETPFIRSALDKLSIIPRFDHRHEYKNAKNMFTETEMTAAHREATETLLRSQFGQMLRGIAQERDMDQEAVRALFNGGPLLGDQALAEGVVDGMAYIDQVRDDINDRTGGAGRLSWSTYLKRRGRPHRRGPKIALIYGTGNVHRGKSGYSPLFGSVSMGSDTVAGAFRSAIDDDDVRGIIFRVDCPGGSAVASDAIWRETVRAREAGKPVVVSMGNVAASGGYWVSMDADRIIAQPGTITASIGVLFGKFLTTGFWNRVGITWDDVQTSDFSAYYSSSYDFTPEGWNAFQAWLDRIYVDFTERVARGRGLPLETVQQIARGRVWTGEDALRLGLVDELGGYPAAMDAMRELLDLPDGAPLHVKLLPREKTRWERLASAFTEVRQMRATAASMGHTLRELRPLATQVREVAVPPSSHGPVHVPPVPDVRDVK